VAFVLGVGLLAFAGWTVRVFVTSHLPPDADLTSRAVWFTGQAVIWCAIVTLAGGVFGLAASAVWRVVHP
jgi:hypothetical protein